MGIASAMPQISLAAAVESPRLARRFVLEHLNDWGCGPYPDLLDRVALMTSELVNNAIVHTGKPFAVSIDRSDEYLTVAVTDLDPTLPKVDRDRTDHAPGEGGWGLTFVERFAEQWGVKPVAGGKAVWFEVSPGGS